MNVGTSVKLTDLMERISSNPDRYRRGVVTAICTHGIVEVHWNGFDGPICMREDEIEPLK